MPKPHLSDHDVIIVKPVTQVEIKNGHHHTVSSTTVQLKHAFAGGLSGAITRAICQPFDMVKIRFQLQVEPINSTHMLSKYNSIPQAVKLITREEGVRGLWKGHNPAQVLSIIYGVAQFWSYEELMNLSKDYEMLSKHTSVANFVCGGISGALATFAASPLDVVRTRLIAQDESKGYRSSIQGLKMITKRDGIPGLYRGVVPSLIQVTPLTGANFMFYKFFNEVAQKTLGYSSEKDIPGYILIMMGGLSGVASKTLFYPMDLCKKRMQIQGFSEHRKTFGFHFESRGFIGTLGKTVKTEGFLGLYKGLMPALLKAAVTTAFHFAFYDEICRLIIKEGE